jgi:hypothetical protein
MWNAKDDPEFWMASEDHGLASTNYHIHRVTATLHLAVFFVRCLVDSQLPNNALTRATSHSCTRET